MKLDGYVRVSGVGGREGEGYISPAVHPQAIENYGRELSGEKQRLARRQTSPLSPPVADKLCRLCLFGAHPVVLLTGGSTRAALPDAEPIQRAVAFQASERGSMWTRCPPGDGSMSSTESPAARAASR